jgi:hypothetical protein
MHLGCLGQAFLKLLTRDACDTLSRLPRRLRFIHCADGIQILHVFGRKLLQSARIIRLLVDESLHPEINHRIVHRRATDAYHLGDRYFANPVAGTESSVRHHAKNGGPRALRGWSAGIDIWQLEQGHRKSLYFIMTNSQKSPHSAIPHSPPSPVQ